MAHLNAPKMGIFAHRALLHTTSLLRKLFNFLCTLAQRIFHNHSGIQEPKWHSLLTNFEIHACQSKDMPSWLIQRWRHANSCLQEFKAPWNKNGDLLLSILTKTMKKFLLFSSISQYIHYECTEGKNFHFWRIKICQNLKFHNLKVA